METIKRLIRGIILFPAVYFAYVLLYIFFIAIGGDPQGSHIWDNLFPIAFGWFVYVLFQPAIHRLIEGTDN